MKTSMPEDALHPNPPRSHCIGVISDTHGLLRPEVLEHLKGVDHIIHAGDVGKPEIIRSLEQVAPLTVVRGNVDQGPWAEPLRESATVIMGDASLYVLHNIDDLYFDAKAAGFQAVIYGHSHRSAIYPRQGVLYINPGSVGPRRFALPVTMVCLTIHGSRIETELISLDE